MIDEGTLRERFPEIPWDQPVLVTMPAWTTNRRADLNRFVCRYCIAMNGLRGADVLNGTVEFAYISRIEALDHIEREHHD